MKQFQIQNSIGGTMKLIVENCQTFSPWYELDPEELP